MANQVKAVRKCFVVHDEDKQQVTLVLNDAIAAVCQKEKGCFIYLKGGSIIATSDDYCTVVRKALNL